VLRAAPDDDPSGPRRRSNRPPGCPPGRRARRRSAERGEGGTSGDGLVRRPGGDPRGRPDPRGDAGRSASRGRGSRWSASATTPATRGQTEADREAVESLRGREPRDGDTLRRRRRADDAPRPRERAPRGESPDDPGRPQSARFVDRGRAPRRGGRRMLLVDGFNVLHTALLAGERDSIWWGRDAREKLLARSVPGRMLATRSGSPSMAPNRPGRVMAVPAARAAGGTGPMVHSVFVGVGGRLDRPPGAPGDAAVPGDRRERRSQGRGGGRAARAAWSGHPGRSVAGCAEPDAEPSPECSVLAGVAWLSGPRARRRVAVPLLRPSPNELS